MSDPSVQIEQRAGVGMITFRGNTTSGDTGKVLMDLTGCSLPDVRQINSHGEWAVAWMSQDEMLLICPHNAIHDCLTTLDKRLEGTHFLAVDMSDARAVFRISGAGSREVLAKGAPVDLARSAFEPGDFRRTRLGQVAVAFWMIEDDTFDLVCFRSVAEHVALWLKTATRPGSPVGFL